MDVQYSQNGQFWSLEKMSVRHAHYVICIEVVGLKMIQQSIYILLNIIGEIYFCHIPHFFQKGGGVVELWIVEIKVTPT